jgi:hypothetical protein
MLVNNSRLKLLYTFSIFSTLFLASTVSVAQQFGDRLLNAQAEFDAGRLYEIPAELDTVLQNGSRDERYRALGLLSKVYLLIDEPEMADSSYIALLEIDPEYIPDTTEVAEIQLLATKFTTSPVFTLKALSIGTNWTLPDVLNSYNVGNDNETQVNYRGQVGFIFGTGFDINFTRSFAIGAEGVFAFRRFQYENIPFDIDVQTVDETNFMFDLPIYIKYTFDKVSFKPFIYAGHAFHWNLINSMNARLSNNEIVGAGVTSSVVEGPSINADKLRVFTSRSLFAGFGAKYNLEGKSTPGEPKLGGARYITAEIRGYYGLTNLLRVQNQFDIEDSEVNALLFRYGYVSDDFTFNGIELKFTIELPIYKPRKRSEGKGIFSKMLKNQR